MNNLFKEFSIKNLTLKNRIVMPPMCMYCAPTTGISTQWHLIHYATRAVGGAGLIIIEATAISPEGRISSHDLGIWDDRHIDGLAQIVDAVHNCGAKIAVQLGHAGRKCEAEGMQIEAPSPLPFKDGDPVPKEMSKQDIKDTIDEFKDAAQRADRAGFDMIQIHGAHGYLISEFLSPLTNHRSDEYGGSPENRIRFLSEILDAVRSVWPEDKPIDVRVSAEDYQKSGNMAEDLGEMLCLIKDRGIDLVNVSTGGVIPVVPKASPGFQVPHAEIIKRMTDLPVAAGGLITDAQYADRIIAEAKADLVYIGRELLRNPYWPLQAARQLGHDIEWPEQYQRAKPK